QGAGCEENYIARLFTNLSSRHIEVANAVDPAGARPKGEHQTSRYIAKSPVSLALFQGTQARIVDRSLRASPEAALGIIAGVSAGRVGHHGQACATDLHAQMLKLLLPSLV